MLSWNLNFSVVYNKNRRFLECCSVKIIINTQNFELANFTLNSTKSLAFIIAIDLNKWFTTRRFFLSFLVLSLGQILRFFSLGLTKVIITLFLGEFEVVQGHQLSLLAAHCIFITLPYFATNSLIRKIIIFIIILTLLWWVFTIWWCVVDNVINALGKRNYPKVIEGYRK